MQSVGFDLFELYLFLRWLGDVPLGDGVVVATALDLAEKGMNFAAWEGGALRGPGRLRPQVHQGGEGGRL